MSVYDHTVPTSAGLSAAQKDFVYSSLPANVAATIVNLSDNLKGSLEAVMEALVDPVKVARKTRRLDLPVQTFVNKLMGLSFETVNAFLSAAADVSMTTGDALDDLVRVFRRLKGLVDNREVLVPPPEFTFDESTESSGGI